MDRPANIELNRRSFMKTALAVAALTPVAVHEAFADLEKDLDSIRRHPLVRIELRDGKTITYNLDVHDVEIIVDIESDWTGSWGSREHFAVTTAAPTYALIVKDGPKYLTTKVSTEYSNDDPEEFYFIVMKEAVRIDPGEEYVRMDTVGGSTSFFKL